MKKEKQEEQEEQEEHICTICKSKIQEKRCPMCGAIIKDRFRAICEACEWESYL